MKLDIYLDHKKLKMGPKMRPFLRAEGSKKYQILGKTRFWKNIKNTSKPKVRQKVEIPFYGGSDVPERCFLWNEFVDPLIRGRRTCIDNSKMTKNWTQKSRAKRHTRLHQMNSKHALQSSKLATNIAHKIHNLSSSSSKRPLFIKNWLRQNRPPQNRKSAILRPSFAEFRKTCMIRQDWLCQNHSFRHLGFAKWPETREIGSASPLHFASWLRQISTKLPELCSIGSAKASPPRWPSFAEFRPTDLRTLDFDVFESQKLCVKSCAFWCELCVVCVSMAFCLGIVALYVISFGKISEPLGRNLDRLG